jgi:amino acid adenylation domain-containing protein/non-ribosomal peptide synthase protein (TIGR01720 family)
MKKTHATPYTKLFWTEWQLNPLSTKYNMVMDQSISGPLDIQRLDTAVKNVIAKYPILHSHLIEENDELLWCENEETIITELERCNSQESLAALTTRPFDLNNGPLLRYGLYQSRYGGDYEFVLVLHHVIIDGLSTTELYDEISHAYCEELSSTDLTDKGGIAEKYEQYLSMLNVLSGFNPAEFWKNALNSIPLVNELPYIHNSCEQQTYQHVQFSLPISQWNTLKSSVKHANTFLIFKTIWALLIARQCQSDAVHIAYPVSMESGSHLQLGAQVNTAVFPFFVHQGDSFSDIYQRTLAHSRSLKATPGLRFTRWPIYDVLQHCGGLRLNVSFAQAHLNNVTLNLTDCQTSCNHRFDNSLANAELVLEYQQQGNNILFRIRYAPNLFARQQITAMAEQYQQLLTLALLHPEKTLENVPLITPDQYREQLTDWNRPHSVIATEPGTLHQTITNLAKRYPQRIALIDGQQQLTYHELDQKSNQLAHGITQRYQEVTQKNIDADTLIPLCLPRSLDMIVTMLAIMKTGAAYIPLEPRLPKQRIHYILADSGVEVLITELGLRAQLQDMALPVELLMLDEMADSMPCSSLPLTVEYHPRQLAYAIYTSGTTGQPKGTLLEHQGVLNMVRGFQAAVSCPDEILCCLQFASIVFDAHVAETYIALCGGHTLVIASDEQRHDLPALLTLIERCQVQFAILPPALLKLQPDLPRCLSRIVVAGESTSQSCFDHYTRLGHQLFNGYGPSEASVCTSINRYQFNGANNIGHPLPGVRLYVLDNNQRPVSVGVAGELYISGLGLARGYLKQPLLTQEKFIANPFAEVNDTDYQRLYRTGDIVRWMPGGELEYIGRNDFQVKIRGHRVELSEIEQAFIAVTSVAHCAVIVQGRDTPRIVAYYVADITLNDESVKRQLSELLPDYMIPSALVQLMSLPLTINGKLDTQVLPEPDYSQTSHHYCPAMTAQEKQLQAVWQQVMGIKDIGINSDFLRLGGDSITAIRLVSEMRRIGMPCRTQDLYQYRSISALIDNIAPTLLPDRVTTEQVNLGQEIPLSPTQQWFFEQSFEQDNYWNQAFLIRVPELDKLRLQQAIEELVSHHDMLSVGFTQETDNHPFRQHYQPELTSPTLRVCHRSSLCDLELQAVFSEWQSGFDYQLGPLWQFGYIDGYQDGSARIFFACHHLIIDAVSWRILAEDLRRLYLGEELGTKSASYQQWVTTLLDYSPTDASEGDYWRQQCMQQADYRPVFTLSDRLNQNYGCLNNVESKRLLQMSGPAHVHRINDVLLTAVLRTLRYYNHSDNHTVILESHGRDLPAGQIDIGRTLGWFTALYPVNFTLSDSPFADIERVRSSLDNVPNEGVSYGVMRYRDNDRQLALRYPGIVFNYLGQFSEQGADWQLVTESAGENSHPANISRDLIIFNIWVAEGQLCFRLDGMLTTASLTEVARQFTHEVQSLIEHCAALPDVIGDELPAALWQELRQCYTPQAVYPCNSLQQGFIYHHVSQPDDASYRVQTTLDYFIDLDPECYRQAWTMAVTHYPILRTCFNWQWQPLQIICSEAELEWAYADYQYETDWQSKLNILCEQQRSQPFDLQQPGLFRLRLVRINEHHYCLVYTAHHSITDGWSGQLLLEYVHQTYLKLQAGQVAYCPPETAYLHTQHYYAEQAEHCRNYWQKRQINQHQANDISYLLSRPYEAKDVKNLEQSTVRCQLPEAVFLSLQQVCQNQGLTLNVMLQFAWHKLLHLYSRQDVTLVGTTLSGRNLPIEGIAESVGLYINTLPLTVEWNNHHSCLQQLQAIQHALNELDEFSYQPLAELSGGGEPLFHTLLVFENYPSVDMNNMHAKIRSAVEKTDYPLNLLAFNEGNGLTLLLTYATDYLTQQKADTLLSLLLTILTHLPTHLYVAHHQLPMLAKTLPISPSAIKHLPQADSFCCIHQRFMDWAIKYPDDIAIIDDIGTCSYGELYQAALILSNQIREIQDRDTALVAILMDKGRNQIISVLATLMAGKAYLPMDKSWPEKRRLTIIEQASVGLVLCDEQWQDEKFTALLLDQSGQVEGRQPPLHLLPPQPVDSDALAYVIFTSGSTGIPKGVAVQHSAAMNTVLDINRRLNIGPTDTAFAISALSFDLSVYDIFGLLSVGGRLVIPGQSQCVQPTAWHALLLQHDVTIWQSAPALFELLMQYVEQYDNQPNVVLRAVMLGGDWVAPALVQRCYAWATHSRFISGWGVTESAIWSTMYEVGPAETFISSIPLGTTLANQSLYVLGEDLGLLPQGMVGELYIGGVGLAQGYFKDVERTAERFVFHPLTGERLYRTGDLGRVLENGDIEFLGRSDSQVKVNGYRIELGEVEKALSAVSEIKQCVALVTKNTPRIVLYYTASQIMDTEYLKSLLAQTLPEYMQPADVIALDNFPLSTSGKIDRQSLPIPEPSANNDQYVAAKSEQERLCCELWARVLRCDAVGINDNFYSRGGNSIQAITLCTRLSQILGCEVTFAAFSANPTVAQLCQHLASQAAPSPTQSIVSLGQVKYPLSSSQMRLWFIEELMQGSNLYHVPILLELSAEINVDLYLLSLQAVVKRHHLLRSRLEQDDVNGSIHFITRNQPLPIEHLQINADEWEDQVSAAINRPFNLRKEYPIRHQLISRRENSGQLTRFSLINIHHIAFDGWSANLLLDELKAHYASFAWGTPLAIPELNIQYADYTHWLITQPEGKYHEARQQFWLDKLDGYQLLALPTDYPRPKEFNHCGATIPFKLDLSLSEQLRSLARDTGVTLHAVLLTGFTLLLSKYSNQQDIIIGAPIANRPNSQIEPLIGLFVNTLALRNFIQPKLSVSELIRQVFANSIACQQYQDMPLEKLVDSLNVERDLSRHPLFQVVFSVEQMAMDSDQQPLFIRHDMTRLYQVAKFDLGLVFEEGQPQLAAHINYSCALFSRNTINNLIQHLQQLLWAMVQTPAARVETLSLLSLDERQKLLQPATEIKPSSDEACVLHHGFMLWAQHYPDDIALVDIQGCYTYGELYQAALVLANQIRNTDVNHSELIAVVMDKGVAQIVAVLAVLMAGRAYLPMDKSWPTSRRFGILQQSGCHMVLTDEPWSHDDFVTIFLDTAGQALNIPYPGQICPAEPTTPDQLAYVIFTSGSTGVPKGVAIQHAAATNTIVDINARLNIGPGDATLAISALSFDLSVYDIFGLLSVGGRLIVPGEKQRYQPDAWCQLMREHKVTLWQSAPALFELLMQHVEHENIKPNLDLGRVMLSGDWIPVNLPQRCHNWAPDCRFISAGGATEAAIWSIMYEVAKGEQFRQSIPYGMALTNQRFYVLDEQLNPVPQGIEGELYIGGSGLSLGYFNDPARTAERFICHPVTGVRLYRTGDLGRFLCDGNIEFRGRIDNQVKINGYRVELGDIENTLMDYGQIEQCMVIKSDSDKGSERLIAYYVSDTPHPHNQLLMHVQERLPGYMVPASFIFLDVFPLNSSGKIDRKQLPLPECEYSDALYVAPQTAQERQLCTLWQEALKQTTVGVTDDFFASGGTSILAISLCQRMSYLLAENIPVVKLFKHRTIREILTIKDYQNIQHLNAYQAEKSNLWMIHPALVGCETYFTFAQALEGSINCIGVDNYNLYHQQQLTNLSELATHYLANMEQQGLLDQQSVQLLGWSMGGVIAMEIAARLEARGIERIHVYLLDSFYQPDINYQDIPNLRQDMLKEMGIHGDSAKRALAVEKAENMISQGQLSGPLRHTYVTLFKATQMSSYHQALTRREGALFAGDNGLGTVCHQLNIILLPCNHHNIIDFIPEIQSVIKSLHS